MPSVTIHTRKFAEWREGEDERELLSESSETVEFGTLTELADFLQGNGFSAQTPDARWLDASYDDPYTGELEECSAHLVQEPNANDAQYDLAMRILNAAVGGPSTVVTLPYDDEGYRGDFFNAYARALIWQTGSDPMQWHSPARLWAVDAFDDDGQSQIFEDCDAFLELVGAELWYAHVTYALGPDTAGQDFALTRNGHGVGRGERPGSLATDLRSAAGFWDRGMGAVGDMLTTAAKSFGPVDVVVGEESCPLL